MNAFSRIIDQAEAILKALPAFSGVPIVPINRGGVESRLDEAIARARTCVLIAPPRADFESEGSAGPVTRPGGARLVLQVIEPPVSAPGDRGALDLALRAAWHLHSANHAPARQDAIPLGLQSIAAQPDPDVLIIEITLLCTLALDPPTP